jgi:hypothetical protein
MSFSDHWFKTIEEARDKLAESITKGVSENGKWGCSTCPTGTGYGWDPLTHEALVWLQANPPAGIKISSRYLHECYDWLAVTDLDTTKGITAQERLDLITRVAEHCYDHTESWERIGSGDGLAYLFWAIAANDGQPFDTSVAPEKYAELIKLIKSHPDGLWEQLEAIGAVI